jgi:predicted nucleic acid-binding protein
MSGVLIAPKKLGYIKTIKPLLVKIIKTNFRLSPEIFNKKLLIAGEN